MATYDVYSNILYLAKIKPALIKELWKLDLQIATYHDLVFIIVTDRLQKQKC